MSAGNAQKVYAVDAKSGQQKWAFSLPEPVRGSIAVQSGILYLGANPSDGMGKSKIYAIDIQTGHEIWSSPTGGSLFSLSTTANGELYVASSDGIVYAWTLPAPSSRASE